MEKIGNFKKKVEIIEEVDKYIPELLSFKTGCISSYR